MHLLSVLVSEDLNFLLEAINMLLFALVIVINLLKVLQLFILLANETLAIFLSKHVTLFLLFHLLLKLDKVVFSNFLKGICAPCCLGNLAV